MLSAGRKEKSESKVNPVRALMRPFVKERSARDALLLMTSGSKGRKNALFGFRGRRGGGKREKTKREESGNERDAISKLTGKRSRQLLESKKGRSKVIKGGKKKGGIQITRMKNCARGHCRKESLYLLRKEEGEKKRKREISPIRSNRPLFRTLEGSLTR